MCLAGVAVGGYDLYTDQYVLSLHQSPVYNDERTISNKTVAFDDSINGWTSLFSYRPDQIFSIRNDFYSTIDSKLYKHHSTDVNRGNFYGTGYESSVTVIFNPEPVRSKTFSTISYEGGSGWKMTALASDATGEDYIDANWISTNDESNSVLSYYEGEYIINPANGQAVVRLSLIHI